ncbi:MAG: hypothetical protein ABIO43_10930 [Sphingomicrobium sp.]
MPGRVRELFEIKDHLSLDQLIERLAEVRSRLPETCDAQLRLSGDDVVGRQLSISYYRDMTNAEAELEERYATEALQAMEVRIDRLREQLEVVNSLQWCRQPARRVA